ncbi:MAG TPA: alpha-L-arabinofuranosidase C-terminal domain-containing protein, partial [Flavisolibacter sp.]
LERNGDVVQMASYAPLFAHADAWQWTPDLIWFDNLRSYGTPNYYVQKLFARNKGTHFIPVMENGETVKGKDSIYASSVIDKTTGEVIVKIVNASSTAVSIETTIEGTKLSKKEGQIEVISSVDKSGVNSFDSPQSIIPLTEKVAIKKNQVSVEIKPLSLTVIRVPFNNK